MKGCVPANLRRGKKPQQHRRRRKTSMEAAAIWASHGTKWGAAGSQCSDNGRIPVLLASNVGYVHASELPYTVSLHLERRDSLVIAYFARDIE